jgi:EpsI family protein
MRIMIHASLAGLLILGAATAGYVMKTKSLMVDKRIQPNYAELVPETFGEWKLLPHIRLVTPVEDDSLANRIYSQMVGRAYADKSGNMVMLLMAYGPRQSDRLQLHRPEICYVAEGFRVSPLQSATLEVEPGRPPLDVSKLVARREGRVERITYWMRIGDEVVSTLFRRQMTTVGYGLQGLIADGVLVRVSTLNMDEATANDVHSRFLRDMLKSVGSGELQHFVGSQAPLIRAGAGGSQRRADPAAGRV